MGHHEQRRAPLPAALRDELQDLIARRRVEVSRGLVGQDQGRLLDDGPRDGDALLLAAGEFVGVAVFLPLEAYPLQGVAGGLRLDPAGKLERQEDVLVGRQGGQEVEELEDETQPGPAKLRAAGFAELLEAAPVDLRLCSSIVIVHHVH